VIIAEYQRNFEAILGGGSGGGGPLGSRNGVGPLFGGLCALEGGSTGGGPGGHLITGFVAGGTGGAPPVPIVGADLVCGITGGGPGGVLGLI